MEQDRQVFRAAAVLWGTALTLLAVGLGCSSAVGADLGAPQGTMASGAAEGASPVTSEEGVPGTVWVAHNGSDDVFVVDEATAEVVARIAVGRSPHNVRVGRVYAYVPNSGDGTLTLVDLATYQPVASVPVGKAPHDAAVAPDESRAFVTNLGSDSVSVVDVARREVVTTVDVGKAPAHARMSEDGRFVYVANSGSGTLSVIETDTLRVSTTPVIGRGPHNLVLGRDGRSAVVTLSDQGGVIGVDLRSGRAGAFVPTGPAPHNLAASPDGRLVYVANTGGSTVVPVRTDEMRPLPSHDLARDAHGIQLDAGGALAFVSSRASNSLSVIDLRTGEIVRVLPVGAAPDGLAIGPPAPPGLPPVVLDPALAAPDGTTSPAQGLGSGGDDHVHHE